MTADDPFADVVVADGTARAVVRAAHAAALCEGHFPDDPLLPGSALAGLIATLAERIVPVPDRIDIVRCAFLHPVRPDGEIIVAATRGPGAVVEGEIWTRGRRAVRATFHVPA